MLPIRNFIKLPLIPRFTQHEEYLISYFVNERGVRIPFSAMCLDPLYPGEDWFDPFFSELGNQVEEVVDTYEEEEEPLI